MADQGIAARLAAKPSCAMPEEQPIDTDWHKE